MVGWGVGGPGCECVLPRPPACKVCCRVHASLAPARLAGLHPGGPASVWAEQSKMSRVAAGRALVEVVGRDGCFPQSCSAGQVGARGGAGGRARARQGWSHTPLLHAAHLGFFDVAWHLAAAVPVLMHCTGGQAASRREQPGASSCRTSPTAPPPRAAAQPVQPPKRAFQAGRLKMGQRGANTVLELGLASGRRGRHLHPQFQSPSPC